MITRETALDRRHQRLGAQLRCSKHGLIAESGREPLGHGPTKPFGRLSARLFDDRIAVQLQHRQATPDPRAQAATCVVAVAKQREVDLAIGIDGFSQLLGYPPFNLWPPRETLPAFRVITGALFGIMNAWLALPYLEQSFRTTREQIEFKLARVGILVR